MRPKRSNIHLPLLKVLHDNHGSLSAQEATNKVISYYPDLKPEDLSARNKSGGNALKNRIRWAKQDLVTEEEIDNSTIGVWKLTEKGAKHLESTWKSWKPEYVQSIPRPEGAEAKETETEGLPDDFDYDNVDFTIMDVTNRVAEEILSRLRNVEPAVFEQIVGELLEKHGYGSMEKGTVKITGRSGDGGIDGELTIDRLGILKAKFQAKRYAADNLVSGDTIRSFAGALTQAHVMYGIFVTTSGYSKGAIEAGQSLRNVRMVNGRELAEMMIEAGLGVRKSKIEVPKIDEEYFEGLG